MRNVNSNQDFNSLVNNARAGSTISDGEGGAANVFDAGAAASQAPTVDVEALHAKIGELTLENDS